MPNPNTDYPPADTDEPEGDGDCACVLVINANDPTGAGGLTADILAVACVGAHPLPVVTGVYRKDTSETLNYTALDDEAVAEQARAVLEDIPVKAFKIGFLGSPETVSNIAEIASDYDETPLIA